MNVFVEIFKLLINGYEHGKSVERTVYYMFGPENY